MLTLFCGRDGTKSGRQKNEKSLRSSKKFDSLTDGRRRKKQNAWLRRESKGWSREQDAELVGVIVRSSLKFPEFLARDL